MKGTGISTQGLEFEGSGKVFLTNEEMQGGGERGRGGRKLANCALTR
jgi:hypothetical protein